jgi:hypothetical protein
VHSHVLPRKWVELGIGAPQVPFLPVYWHLKPNHLPVGGTGENSKKFEKYQNF